MLSIRSEINYITSDNSTFILYVEKNGEIFNSIMDYSEFKTKESAKNALTAMIHTLINLAYREKDKNNATS